jgi:clan AA aspartic protease (TIGR02281 family)
MLSGASRWILAFLTGFAALLPALASADRVPVPETLERLAQDGGFEVTGLDKAEGADGRDEAGEIYARLRALLDGFNHVIVQAPGGGVAKVIILSRKTAWVPPPASGGSGATMSPPADPGGDIVAATERRGTSHLVTARLEGEGGKRVEQVLTVDTGADFVVLPASLLGPLGISGERLENREVQTANGKTAAQIGHLAGIWFGDRKVADVQVAFIDDARLGGSALLGMSVLSRYRMTIDDEANRLTLAPK